MISAEIEQRKQKGRELAQKLMSQFQGKTRRQTTAELGIEAEVASSFLVELIFSSDTKQRSAIDLMTDAFAYGVWFAMNQEPKA